MLSSGSLVGVIAVSLAMVLTPGPNMIYLVSRSISQGHKAGLISLAGIAAGFLVYLLATIAGLTAVFTLVPVLFLAIKICGSCYLLWIAWTTVRPGGKSVFATRYLPHDRTWKLFTMGVMSTLLNPKIAIMYMSLLPQFVDTHRGNVGLQSLLLGCIQISISLTIDAVYVFTATKLASFLGDRPKWLRAQRYMMGSLLAGFALRIATS